MPEDRSPLDLARIGEYRLTVLVGEPTAPGGLTRVRLDGTGRIQAEQVFATAPVGPEAQTAEIVRDGGRVTDRASGELRHDEVANILRQASLVPWGQPDPSRSGVPPEAITNWSFRTADGREHTLRMWLRDAEADEAVGPVLRELNRHLLRIAKGTIFF